MYVSFPVSFREALELRQKYATRGGFNAVVIRIRLPDGRLYQQSGKLDFVNNTIAANTDTITLRGEIANPLLYSQSETRSTVRELYDGEFVSVLLEGVQPIEVLAVPRVGSAFRPARQIMSMSSAPTTRPNSAASSWASRRRPSRPWSAD